MPEEPVPGTADRILGIFDEAGMRNTRQRREIAERLAGYGASGQEFTTEDLWKRIQQDDTGIGRATVYRAIDLLHREGVLDRVGFPDGSHRYRLCGAGHHHHVTCVDCQRIIEIDICLPPEVVSAIASATDFTIEGHAIEFFGRCGACRAKAS